MTTLEIIIPAYNAHKTIINTLNSLTIQTLKDFHITIVNDCGKPYTKIITNYKDKLHIEEITTNTNVGPGLSRQYGIDSTNSKYIVFIDADDYLSSADSLNLLVNSISNSKADVVISNFIYKRDNKEEIKRNNTVWLHGKIYKREFLEKHHIKFNNSRYNEDNGFNSLIFLLKPIVCLLNQITYVYEDNSTSITRKNNREYKFTGMEGYAYNINWAIEEAIKRNASKEAIAIKIIEGLSVLYESYNNCYNQYDVEQIIIWSKDLYQKYLIYKEIASNYIESALKYRNINKQYITFNEFIEKINRLL